MQYIIIILIILLIISNIIPKKKNKTTDDIPDTTKMDYPYKRKYLLTKAEYAFYRILKEKCDILNIMICPKVRLEDFIDVTTKENKQKYRGYIKSRHIDFLLCDNNLNIIGAIELDDNTHQRQNVKKADAFKNELFEKVKIPLYRVSMSDGLYDERISEILIAIKQ